MMEKITKVAKRVLFDIVLFVVVILLFLSKVYEHLPPPVQILAMKVILASAGFLHAHITRKIAFPKVDWYDEKFTPHKVLVIVLYFAFILAYTFSA